ncbi:MAG: HEPN domain-containing protein [Bacteroidaceae bacterium]|nr:HEPN domain-containing protein [Bacteroidaceae bacterium]
MTDKQREEIVSYRIQSAEATLEEVKSHRENGFYNTAVNRLYYACFYAANALLIANGIEVKSHEGVRQKLGQLFVLTGKLTPEHGKFYSQLFNKRSTGDYDDFVNHDLQTVDNLFPRAVDFIKSIKILLQK